MKVRRYAGLAVGISLLFLGWWVWKEYRLRLLYGDARLLPYTPSEVYRHGHVMTLGRAVEPAKVLPRYFKWAERMLVAPRTQGQCASCWAFAICDSMADRVSLHTRGMVRNHLSPQELLSCFMPRWFPCHKGGIPEVALQYVIARGLVQEDAYPYENVDSTSIEQCKIGKRMGFWEVWNIDAQRHEKNPHRIFAKEGSIRSLCEDPVDQSAIDRNIQNMKVEIMTNGPIIGTIMVYDDLYAYDADKVYEVGPNARLMGGHAVEIFGWSDEGANTLEKGFQGGYWHVKNTWGDVWPNNLPKKHAGWFYVRMGRNEAGIESRASCAEPLLTERMKAMGKTSSWLSGAYTSYDAYVNDPERQNFFSHLAERRRNQR